MDEWRVTLYTDADDACGIGAYETEQAAYDAACAVIRAVAFAYDALNDDREVSYAETECCQAEHGFNGHGISINGRLGYPRTVVYRHERQ